MTKNKEMLDAVRSFNVDEYTLTPEEAASFIFIFLDKIHLGQINHPKIPVKQLPPRPCTDE